MKLKQVLLGLAMIFGFAGAAGATVMDFPVPGNNMVDVGPVYEANGFRLVTDATFFVVGVNDYAYSGSPSLVVADPVQFPATGATTTLTRTDGGLFALNRIDLSEDLFAFYTFPVTFSGISATNGMVQQDFWLDGMVGAETFSFDSTLFTDLVSVSWQQGDMSNFTSYHFANVDVTPLNGPAVPEPVTVLLLASGVLGLVGMYKRRKN